MAVSLLSRLLPTSGLVVTRWHVAASRLIISVRRNTRAVRCPECNIPSVCIHGRYCRTVADLSWAGQPARLEVEVRRFRCHSGRCSPRTFAESFPGLIAPRQRRTVRQQEALWHLGLAPGGAPAARLAQRLGIVASGDTILRHLKRGGVVTPVNPTVVGIDDWAFKRGHRCGTLLVDLRSHRPIDLLPDRETASVAAWLASQRTVRIIARDRAGCYSDAARQGAPQAIQVADRWHVLKNLGDALERLMSRYSPALRRVANAVATQDAEAVPIQAIEPAGPQRPTRASLEQAQRRARRKARYDEVVRCRQSGMSIRAVAITTRLDRRTVRDWLHAGHFPERATRRAVPTQVDPYQAYLMQRWRDGCRNARALWHEVRMQGFAGSYSTLRRALQPWRKAQALTLRRKPASLIVPAPRRARQWLLRLCRQSPRQGDCSHIARFIELLCAQNPQIATARTLAHEFVDMFRRRRPEALSGWLRRAMSSGTQELRALAMGLNHDYDAVRAGLELPWSNGMVEGHINRLKCLKRQMYGRAGLELLRVRVLNRA